MKTAKKGRQRGVHSIEKGYRLVSALSKSGGPLTLTSLSRAAGMSASAAHRYLVSFIRISVIEQLANGTYDLGIAALNAGLAKLSRLDHYQVAQTCIESLGSTCGETALLSIWNGRSAVGVRWVESRRPVAVFVRPGFQLPLLASATGRIFAAFLPDEVTRDFIDQELKLKGRSTWNGAALDEIGVRRMLKEIRASGLARVHGDLTEGIDAIAAPVFNRDEQIAFSFALVGTSGSLDTRDDSPIAKALLDAARECTVALGGSGRLPTN